MLELYRCSIAVSDSIVTTKHIPTNFCQTANNSFLHPIEKLFSTLYFKSPRKYQLSGKPERKRANTPPSGSSVGRSLDPTA